jgi:uncharacterized membrane protein
MTSKGIQSFFKSRKLWLTVILLFIIGVVVFKKGYVHIPKNIDFELEALKKHLVWIVLVFLSIAAIAWLIFKPKAWKAILLIFAILLGVELGVYYYFSDKNNTKPTDTATTNNTPEKTPEENKDEVVKQVEPSVIAGSYVDTLQKGFELNKKFLDSVILKQNEEAKAIVYLKERNKVTVRFSKLYCIQDSMIKKASSDLASLKLMREKLEKEVIPPCECPDPAKDVVQNAPSKKDVDSDPPSPKRPKVNKAREQAVVTQETREKGVVTVPINYN